MALTSLPIHANPPLRVESTRGRLPARRNDTACSARGQPDGKLLAVLRRCGFSKLRISINVGVLASLSAGLNVEKLHGARHSTENVFPKEKKPERKDETKTRTAERQADTAEGREMGKTVLAKYSP